MICPICGRPHFSPPATSRNGFRDICPVCGAEEVLSLSGISNNKKKEINKGYRSILDGGGRRATDV